MNLKRVESKAYLQDEVTLMFYILGLG